MIPHHKDKKIEEVYDVTDELGSGSFSTVRLVKHKQTGQQYAAKIIAKDDGPAATEKGKEMIDIEIEVLRRAKHSSIISLHEIYETETAIYLVLDLVRGGELFDQIVEMSSYSEASAAKVVRQLTSAIEHLHLKSVVHRDLKPENLLLSEKSDTADVMLADFGLAALVDDGKPLRAAVGTPGYIAPEVLLTLEDDNITYDKAADIFGIGVIMYILLCGFPPFYAEDDDDLFDLTIEGDYSYPSPFWDHVSPEAKDLIDRMLCTDPKQRFTCEQILKHTWLNEKNNTEPMQMAQEQMKQWRARKRWKKGINSLIAAQKFNFGRSLIAAAKEMKAKEEAEAAAAKAQGDAGDTGADAKPAVDADAKADAAAAPAAPAAASAAAGEEKKEEKKEILQPPMRKPKNPRGIKRADSVVRSVAEANKGIGGKLRGMFGKMKGAAQAAAGRKKQ